MTTLVKPSVVKPARFTFFEAMKALEGGDDSNVRSNLQRMEKDEIDYLLQLTRRLNSFLKVRLSSIKKIGGII